MVPLRLVALIMGLNWSDYRSMDELKVIKNCGTSCVFFIVKSWSCFLCSMNRKVLPFTRCYAKLNGNYDIKEHAEFFNFVNLILIPETPYICRKLIRSVIGIVSLFESSIFGPS